MIDANVIGQESGFSQQALKCLLKKPQSSVALANPNPVDWLNINQVALSMNTKYF